MRRFAALMSAVAMCLAAVASLSSQSRSRDKITAYEGARLIVASGWTIERGVLLVENGRIAAVGDVGAVKIPSGASRVDLIGKTVMPAMINAHVHIGYEGYVSWGAQDYSPENIVDHLQREAFYGIAATQTVGSSPTDASIQFERDQQAGRFPPASRFLFMPGMAPPNGGPDAILLKGTSTLHAVYEVTTAADARTAVQSMAARQLKSVKIWVDDRRGTYPKMSPDVYTAIIDEAHKHQMKVNAHATTLADQKAVVRAGVDVLVHTVQSEKLDDEFLQLLRERKPYWTTVIGLGDRSEVCNNDPFVDQSYPESVLASIRQASCGPAPANAAARESILANNVQQMVAAGARLVLGTDAGITARHAFGWADHHEIARWVQLGLTPAQAIEAATSRPAELLGLDDLGTLAPGKSADFIVLDANPLEDIRNTRRIGKVYLGGVALDRKALVGRWKNLKP
jgi:imidazolonepropionase-like amidohydrolase